MGPCVLTVLIFPPVSTSNTGLVSSSVSFCAFDTKRVGVREPSEFGTAVNGVFVREVPLAAADRGSSFGTILCGLETMRSAWPTLEHVFSVRVGSSAQGAAGVSEPGLVFSGSRYPLGLLKANPVDLLVIRRGGWLRSSELFNAPWAAC
jgi:hypothetical protein